MKIVTAVTTTLVLAGALATPAAAQRNAAFAGAVQRAEADHPGFLKSLEQPLTKIAEEVLTDVSVESVTIDPRTGEMVVRGTRGGTPVRLAGPDIGGDAPPPDEFGWLVCVWNWFTSLGADGCADEQAEVAPMETPWDRAEGARKRAAFLEMTGGAGDS